MAQNNKDIDIDNNSCYDVIVIIIIVTIIVMVMITDSIVIEFLLKRNCVLSHKKNSWRIKAKYKSEYHVDAILP